MHQKECNIFIYLQKIPPMKSILTSLTILFVFASCGKYEKPFITFKSPEKRISATWKQDKFTNNENIESSFDETISFSIVNDDSLFTRTVNGITFQGNWTWMPALDGKVDKERVKVSCPEFNKVLTIKVLTSKNLEFIDQSSDYRYYYSKN
jgi:hypothetical protein